jgi:hypothetical protein
LGEGARTGAFWVRPVRLVRFGCERDTPC